MQTTMVCRIDNIVPSAFAATAQQQQYTHVEGAHMEDTHTWSHMYTHKFTRNIADVCTVVALWHALTGATVFWLFFSSFYFGESEGNKTCHIQRSPNIIKIGLMGLWALVVCMLCVCVCWPSSGPHKIDDDVDDMDARRQIKCRKKGPMLCCRRHVSKLASWSAHDWNIIEKKKNVWIDTWERLSGNRFWSSAIVEHNTIAL